jgi:TetR/AcrR family transcriptional regulator, regulator of autoinduction and epiphytic fitness
MTTLYETMSSEVKRPVKSRASRARATRRRIIESATRLFETDGYADTTMERVAEEAKVAVQTVYYTFGTKGQLLCEAMEFAAAGTHDPEPVHQREWMMEALREQSASRSLALAIEHGTEIYERASPLWPAVNAAAVIDDAVAVYWEGVTAGRRAGMRQLIAHLDGIGGLRDGLDDETATDIIFALNSHATFQALVVESGWTIPAFNRWLYSTLTHQLLPSEDGAGEDPGMTDRRRT